MAGGVRGAAGADAEATATGREGEGATIPGLGRGARIAGAAVPKKEAVQVGKLILHAGLLSNQY